MKTTLTILHHQSTDWIRELEFYVEELALLTVHLDETMAKNAGKEFMQGVTHYKSRFVELREQADVLKADIQIREKKIEKVAEEFPAAINEQMRLTDDGIFDRMKTLAHSVAVVRYEFNGFLAKTI